MLPARVLSICYEEPDSIEHQGTRQSIRPFIKKGYYVKNESNGNWVLVKPTRVIITLQNSSGISSFNIKQDIVEYYGKKRISKKMIENFENEIKQGRIKFGMAEDCRSYSF